MALYKIRTRGSLLRQAWFKTPGRLLIPAPHRQPVAIQPETYEARGELRTAQREKTNMNFDLA